MIALPKLTLWLKLTVEGTEVAKRLMKNLWVLCALSDERLNLLVKQVGNLCLP